MKLKIEKKLKYVMGIIDGDFGDGKTLFLTALAVNTFKNYDYVYANYLLKDIPNFILLEKINKPTLLNLKPNSLLLVTEAYLWLDRRYCMKKENIKTTHALFQIRKTKIDQFYDVPDANYLDFRAMDFSNFHIRAKGEIGNGIFVYCPLIYIKNNMRYKEGKNLFVKPMDKYYNYYDTFEITERQPLITSFTK